MKKMKRGETMQMEGGRSTEREAAATSCRFSEQEGSCLGNLTRGEPEGQRECKCVCVAAPPFLGNTSWRVANLCLPLFLGC